MSPYELYKIYPGSSAVTGGHADPLVVQILGPAGPSGNLVTLHSSSNDLTVPSSINVPAGKTGVSFQATSKTVSSVEPITVTASFDSSEVQTTVSLNPNAISKFYVSPSTITGGITTHGVVQLAGAAGPNGNVITLHSPSSNVVVPATVTVPAGKTGVSFSITTKSVTASTQVSLTATESLAAGPGQLSTNVNLEP